MADKSMKRINILIIIMLLALFVVFYLFLKPTSYLEVTFLDVGQGDCAFIKTPDGKHILIDGGGKTDSDTVGKNILEPFLRHNGVFRLDAVFVSHYHDDHAKGITEIMDNIPVSALIMPDVEEKPELHDLLYEKAKAQNSDIYYMSSGQDFNFDFNKIKVEALFPDRKLYPNIEKNGNNDSLILRMEYFNTSFLFTGDIEGDAERLLSKNPKLKSDVLKVAHHGSDTSTCDEVLAAIRPKYAVIGVGANNSYGHPASETLKKLNTVNAEIMRTDEDGTITFFVDEEGIVKINKSRRKQ